MRDINYIVIHCTATAQTATIAAITRYWRDVLKWKSPGYHYIIEPSGNVVNMQVEDKPTNGVAGFNARSLHISYIGGVDANGRSVDNRTPQQRDSMLLMLKKLRVKYPNAVILGHRDFPNVHKDCPCFDARKEYKNL